MTLGVNSSAAVLLSGLVLLPFRLVGQVQAALLLGRPTVLPSSTSCTHVRSGHYSRLWRACVLLAFSLYTREK